LKRAEKGVDSSVQRRVQGIGERHADPGTSFYCSYSLSFTHMYNQLTN